MKRIQRILPFQIQNAYVKRLIAVTYPTSAAHQHHHKRTSSTSLTSSSSANLLSQSQQPVSVALVSQTPHFKPWEWVESIENAETSATAVTNPDVLNDGPISLSLFGALRVGTEELLYNRMFNDGWQASDVRSVRNVLTGIGADGDVIANGTGMTNVDALGVGRQQQANNSNNLVSNSGIKRKAVGETAVNISPSAVVKRPKAN